MIIHAVLDPSTCLRPEGYIARDLHSEHLNGPCNGPEYPRSRSRSRDACNRCRPSPELMGSDPAKRGGGTGSQRAASIQGRIRHDVSVSHPRTALLALSLSFGAAHAQDAMKAADPMKAGAMKSDT